MTRFILLLQAAVWRTGEEVACGDLACQWHKFVNLASFWPISRRSVCDRVLPGIRMPASRDFLLIER